MFFDDGNIFRSVWRDSYRLLIEGLKRGGWKATGPWFLFWVLWTALGRLKPGLALLLSGLTWGWQLGWIGFLRGNTPLATAKLLCSGPVTAIRATFWALFGTFWNSLSWLALGCGSVVAMKDQALIQWICALLGIFFLWLKYRLWGWRILWLDQVLEGQNMLPFHSHTLNAAWKLKGLKFRVWLLFELADMVLILGITIISLGLLFWLGLLWTLTREWVLYRRFKGWLFEPSGFHVNAFGKFISGT